MRIELIPAFTDNYIFLGQQDPKGSKCFVVDPGDAEPVLDYLNTHALNLEYILLTHHHADHTGGVNQLRQQTNCQVIGHKKDAHRLPKLDQAIDLSSQRILTIWNLNFDILSIEGHTSGHIAFYNAENRVLFCGDTLFSLGCGRVFDGSIENLYASLQKIKELPDETLVYCAHEYTLSNGKFALHLDPQNPDLQEYVQTCVQKRDNNRPTIPCKLGLEKTINPFLTSSDLETFRWRRLMKDSFP